MKSCFDSCVTLNLGKKVNVDYAKKNKNKTR